METAERISLPDDCTVGYIVNALLGASLTRSPLFHSHLENLGLVSDVRSQVRARMQQRRSVTRTAPLNPASSPLGDAQLRAGREREERGQPEGPVLTQGRPYQVKTAESLQAGRWEIPPDIPREGRTEIYVHCLRYDRFLWATRSKIKGQVIVFEVFLVLKSLFFFYSSLLSIK